MATKSSSGISKNETSNVKPKTSNGSASELENKKDEKKNEDAPQQPRFKLCIYGKEILSKANGIADLAFIYPVADNENPNRVSAQTFRDFRNELRRLIDGEGKSSDMAKVLDDACAKAQLLIFQTLHFINNHLENA